MNFLYLTLVYFKMTVYCSSLVVKYISFNLYFTFQCIIDLKENCLRIGTTTTLAPFLAEKDIPKQDSEQGPSSSAQSTPGTTPKFL